VLVGLGMGCDMWGGVGWIGNGVVLVGLGRRCDVWGGVGGIGNGMWCVGWCWYDWVGGVMCAVLLVELER
jgi:hypothetical protein